MVLVLGLFASLRFSVIYRQLDRRIRNKIMNDGEKSIFDKDTSDLPCELISQLTERKQGLSISEGVVRVFEEAPDKYFDTNLVLIGFYRLHKITISRSSAGNALSRLVRFGLIDRVERDNYRLNKSKKRGEQ
jgi:hypothetical protein